MVGLCLPPPHSHHCPPPFDFWLCIINVMGKNLLRCLPLDSPLRRRSASPPNKDSVTPLRLLAPFASPLLLRAISRTWVVLGGMKCKPAAPRHDMAPQIIWFSWCFIVATFSFIQRESNGDDVWQSSVLFFFFLHHWCQVWLSCRPVGLQSNFLAETSWNSDGTYSCTF